MVDSFLLEPSPALRRSLRKQLINNTISGWFIFHLILGTVISFLSLSKHILFSDPETRNSISSAKFKAEQNVSLSSLEKRTADQNESLNSLDDARKQCVVELQTERGKRIECGGKLVELNTTQSNLIDQLNSARKQCLVGLFRGFGESNECEKKLAEATNVLKRAYLEAEQYMVETQRSGAKLRQVESELSSCKLKLLSYNQALSKTQIATHNSGEETFNVNGAELDGNSAVWSKCGLKINFRQLSEYWSWIRNHLRSMATACDGFLLCFVLYLFLAYLIRYYAKVAKLKIKTTLQQAWELAWKGQWDEAENFLKKGEAWRCQFPLFESKDGFSQVSQYMARVKSRVQDPRNWTRADVHDFLQCSMQRVAPLTSVDVDGAGLMRDKSLLLAHWTGSSNRGQLESISRALDDMVVEANVRGGSLDIEKARVIRESDVKLDERPFAAGSAADVYNGVWTARGKEVNVVVKVLRSLSASSLGAGNADLQSLIREVGHLRVASASEHVVTYHGVMLGQRCGIVMDQEFCCLGRVLEQKMLRDTRYRLRMLLDAAAGLRGIHKAGIVHGDIKPSNLLLSASGRIKIADFSHSAALCTQCSQMLTQTVGAADRKVSGTAHYISPEAWSGNRTAAADVWAYGLIVWHLLTGLLMPWDKGLEISQIICRVVNERQLPALPAVLEIPPPTGPQLVRLYNQSCAYAPDSRPPASKLVDSLEAMLEETRRQDELPPTWSVCAGRDEYEVRSVLLARGSAEYADVAGCFASTCTHPVVSIERIQNKEQWNLFRQKRQVMEARASAQPPAAGPGRAGANEKRLFHGTRPETVSLINQKSFNRSYCSVTLYGKGTYFACKASYSAQSTYSPPDAQGRRYMYLARVLVGASAPGNRDMKEPPRLPGDPTRTYDSMCDSEQSPSMYVVYHDAQAYPEYLITFTTA